MLLILRDDQLGIKLVRPPANKGLNWIFKNPPQTNHTHVRMNLIFFFLLELWSFLRLEYKEVLHEDEDESLIPIMSIVKLCFS